MEKSRPTLRAERLAILALLAGAVTLGFAPILVRLSDLGPTATAGYRFLLAVPLYWAIAAVAPQPAADQSWTVRDFLLAALAGASLAADMGAWHFSIHMTTVANATVLPNVAPVFVVIGGWLIFRERVTGTFLIGLIAAMIGVFVLTEASFTLGRAQFVGDLLGLLTALFYAVYQMSIMRLRQRFSTIAIMARAIPVSAVSIMPFAAASGDALVASTLAGWSVLVALAAGPQVLGHGLIAWALAHLPVAFASVTLLAQPVTAAIVAWILFDERIGGQQAIAAAAILAGISVARRGSMRR